MKHFRPYIFLLTLIGLGITGAKAQIGFSAGIAGGVSTGAVKISGLDTAVANIAEGRQISGFEAGIYARINLLPFYIKPQLMYVMRSGNVTVNRGSDQPSTTEKFSMQKVEVPLFLGLRLVGPLSLEAGPVFNYVTLMTEEFNGQPVKVANTAVGYRAGLSLDFERFFINANYQGVTYSANDGGNRFREPYKVTLGLGIALIGKSTKL